MITRTGFPEYIEAIAIGDSPEFLRQNSPELCSLLDDFPEEINLAYLWKKIEVDPDTNGALRIFTKNFLLDAPKLSTEHIIYYRNKILKLPPSFRNNLIKEVESGFKKVDNLIGNMDDNIGNRNFQGISLDNDNNFLSRLAALMRECESACNYFKNLSHRVGSIYDFSLVNSIHNSPVQDKNFDTPPPTPLSLEKLNKLPPSLLDSHAEAYLSVKAFLDKSRERLHNWVSTHNLESLAKKGENSDESGAVHLGATSPSTFRSTMEAYSNSVANSRAMLGDCFRIVDYMSRYNPFNPQMNVAMPINKTISIKTLSGYKAVNVNMEPVDFVNGKPFDNTDGPKKSLDDTSEDG